MAWTWTRGNLCHVFPAGSQIEYTFIVTVDVQCVYVCLGWAEEATEPVNKVLLLAKFWGIAYIEPLVMTLEVWYRRPLSNASSIQEHISENTSLT